MTFEDWFPVLNLKLLGAGTNAEYEKVSRWAFEAAYLAGLADGPALTWEWIEAVHRGCEDPDELVDTWLHELYEHLLQGRGMLANCRIIGSMPLFRYGPKGLHKHDFGADIPKFEPLKVYSALSDRKKPLTPPTKGQLKAWAEDFHDDSNRVR